MNIGLLVSDQDIKEGALKIGADFFVAEKYIGPDIHQDLAFINPENSLWTRRKERFIKSFSISQENNLRFWISITDLIFGTDTILKVIENSTTDIVFYGSTLPTFEAVDKLKDVRDCNPEINIHYSPFSSFHHTVIDALQDRLVSLANDGIVDQDLILSVMPSNLLASYLIKNQDICSTIVLWNYSEAKKFDIFEIIRRNDMAKKSTSKAKQNLVTPQPPTMATGTVIVGPLGVRKEPSIESNPFKALVKGTEVPIIEFYTEVKPKGQFLFGKIANDQWILIENGKRAFVSYL